MRTMRPGLLNSALVTALVLGVAACSSGGRSLIPAPAPTGAAELPTVRFTIVVRKSHAKGRRPDYISASTKSATVAVGHASPVKVDLTPASKGCSKRLPLTCTVDVLAPPGKDTFTVTLYDKLNGLGKRLSVGVAIATIVKAKLNTVHVTCNGVVASLALDLAQGSPPTGVSQPIALTVSGLDADGNTIVAPGTYDNGPVIVKDGDTAHTQLQLGSGTPGSSVSVAGPGASVNVLYDGSASLTSATLTASMPNAATVTPATADLTPVASQISIDTASGLASPIPQDLLGANMPAWIDDTQSYIAPAIAAAGLHLIRWPGGSLADDYHWGDNIGHTPTTPCAGAYADLTDSTFDNFMTYAVPAGVDVAITTNYGSNIACNGPGTAAEAADWAAYSKSKGYNVKYWTVGNENYGGWETDMHAAKHDGTTYSNAMNGPGGYYAQIKAADPNAKVGVPVSGPSFYGGTAWDDAVLQNAKFDYVELHYYAQSGSGSYPGGAESDSYILGQGVTNFANSLAALRSEMSSKGVPATVPIYLGELNTVVTTAGKQTVSITNGLFAGMAMAEVMKQPGVQMATWWLAFGDCETAATGGNFSSQLYGFQNFGAYTLFSDQASGCGTEDTVAAGTPFPDGRAYAILSQFAGQGSTIRNVTTSLPTTTLRVYADTLGSGYGVLLFNLNENNPATYTVALDNTSQATFTATQITYGKAQYDQSQGNVWAGPVTSSLGTLGRGFSVTLPPWSMNLVKLVPVAADRKRHVP